MSFRVFSATRQSRCQLRVIFQHRTDTDHDCIRLVTHLVDILSTQFIADPLGVTGRSCGLSVKRHRHFQGYQRLAAGYMFGKRCNQAAALSFHEADGNLYAGLFETFDPPP